MEELSPSGSGHPYLPGTASLVQEIDSNIKLIVKELISFFSPSRANACHFTRLQSFDWLLEKCRSIWYVSEREWCWPCALMPLFEYFFRQFALTGHDWAHPRREWVWRYSSGHLLGPRRERGTLWGNSELTSMHNVLCLAAQLFLMLLYCLCISDFEGCRTGG